MVFHTGIIPCVCMLCISCYNTNYTTFTGKVKKNRNVMMKGRTF